MPEPISIPTSLLADDATILLLTQWRNCHARYRVCTRRVNWKNRLASEMEKRRRREKWQHVARILEIERTILRWIGKETHHPDLWSNKKGTVVSRRRKLMKRYIKNVYTTHHAAGDKRNVLMEVREDIVNELRAIERKWMVAMYEAVFPDKHAPRAIELHPRELFPRKIKAASKALQQEVAA